MLELVGHDRPTPEAALTADDLRQLRLELEQQREFRLHQLEQLAAAVLAATGFSADEPQHAVILDLQSAASATLADINAALQRIRNGTYGLCHQCDTAIPRDRLTALPMARLCMHCQRMQEVQVRRTASRISTIV